MHSLLDINIPGMLDGKNCDELTCACGTSTWVPKWWHAAGYTCVQCFVQDEARDE